MQNLSRSQSPRKDHAWGLSWVGLSMMHNRAKFTEFGKVIIYSKLKNLHSLKIPVRLWGLSSTVHYTTVRAMLKERYSFSPFSPTHFANGHCPVPAFGRSVLETWSTGKSLIFTFYSDNNCHYWKLLPFYLLNSSPSFALKKITVRILLLQVFLVYLPY